MDDRDFIDLLYQGWSKTTGAESMFWMPEEDEQVERVWHIYAVDQEQMKTWVGDVHSEDDAAWITALHGCFGDLVRRLHEALDESDRLDERADEREAEIADLILESEGLKQQILELEYMLEEVGR